MQWNEVMSAWQDVKHRIRFRWCQLTDEELEQAGGERDRIVARIERRYGERKENIERELDALVEAL